MNAKTIGVVAGAGLLGAAALGAGKGKSVHTRCKEACARMAGKEESGEGEAHQGCKPAPCRQ